MLNRFPFIAYRNGGAAFLIPYAIVLILIGRPIYLMEMAIGQFCSSGPVGAWNIAPFFKGVGYTAMLSTACVLSYYVPLMGLSAYYTFLSFNATLPWTRCSAAWAPDVLCVNGTFQANLSNSSLAELYYSNDAFPRWANIDDGVGPPHLHLVICLLLSWLVVFLSLVGGVRKSGKIAYVTAFLPYAVLIILFCRGACLEGGWDGITLFIVPDFSKLMEWNTWLEAIGQCFFSLSVGSGPVVMLASYNTFSHDIQRDSLIVVLVDTLTSLLAGLTTFAVLGNLAAGRNVSIAQIVNHDSDFSFTYIPEAISGFKIAPQLFSAMFFVMLFTLGLGTSTTLTGGIVTIVCDKFPHWRKWPVTLIICLVGFLIGVVYVTPGASFMVKLADNFGAGFVVYIAVMLEISAVCWVYGLNSFCHDVEFMLGRRLGCYWKLCWCLITPLLIGCAIFHILSYHGQLTHGFPAWAMAVGWTLAAASLMFVPLFAIHAVYLMQSATIIGKIKMSLRPTKEWGPNERQTREAWMLYKNSKAKN